MREKHKYSKERAGNVQCIFCPKKYKNRKNCEQHMKVKHDHNAAAERRKENEELFIIKSQQRQIEREKKASFKEEARHVKEKAKLKDKEEKDARKAERIRRKLEKAKKEEETRKKKQGEKERKQEEKKAAEENRKAVSFDFNRDILGGAIYCAKCNKAFTSDEEKEKHEMRHDDPKNFRCSKCHKTFKKMDNKEMHEKHCGEGTSVPRDVAEDDNEEDEEDFSPIKSALSAKVYRLKFAPGIRNLYLRLQRAIMEASDQLFTIQKSNRNIKYYVSLQCTFYKPTDPGIVTDPPVTFNSGTTILLPTSTIKEQMEINYQNIIQAIENYETNGSGWVLLRLNMIDLNIVRYNPWKTAY